METLEEILKMNEIQYLIGGALSFLVSTYVLVKRPRTLASKYLLIFGLTITVWEGATFLYRTAPDVSTAMLFFRIMILSSHLCYPIFLFTILNIQEKRDYKSLLVILLPVILQIALIFQYQYIANYEFFQNELGWVYKVNNYQPILIIVSVIFVSYLLGIVFALLVLIKNTKVQLLRKKYIIILTSFVSFQILGTTLINALQATEILDPIYQLGGIMQFLAFLTIWYALSLKEEIPSKSSLKLKGFSEIYSSFLRVYYNHVVSSHLGEEFFELTNFIRDSEIDDFVLFDKITITFSEPENFDVINLLNKNLRYFEKYHITEEIMDYYLRVLKAADYRLEWKLYDLINENQNILKKSDLIYGISQGKFLENITRDESLDDLNEVDACLRIYKRILLPIMDRINQDSEILKDFTKTDFIKDIRITEYGEVSIKELREQIHRVPSNQQLQYIIETFNTFLSRVYDRLLINSEIEIEEILKKLRLVLILNKDVAISLGVYPKLLGTLATKVPKTQIHKLYADYLKELIDEKTRELKVAQENLLKSQRFAVIGEAASMVGHDLRNPLQVIVNVLYLAERKLESSPNKDLENIFNIIKDQVEYMNKIVSDLQDFARPIKPNFIETSLRQLLDEIFPVIRIPSNITVSIDIKKNALKILTDPYFLKRIFTNLFINAVQAMPDGGQLLIMITGTMDDVIIAIKDNGIGIPKENINKLFQPLFTTKAKGQGLGLAVCKHLIEALNGSINVESTAGKGTTFTIKIPRGTKVALKKEIPPSQLV
jgi:signal transduction histidine kinase